MFMFAGFTCIAFISYFAVVFGFFPLTVQSMKIASLSLDIGLFFSVVGIVTIGVALWRRRARVGVCVLIGVLLLALSALALYATRYI
jgi:uncharacterized membrane protein HdeD (DUF308 family)